ncbi:MAG TPA: BrnT family toxin, partial [Dehalococcoidia bacterium]
MEFDWDDGNIDKNLKHNVHDWEIEEAFFDPAALVSFHSSSYGEQRRVMLARVETSGRYLHVV